jgi:hypothetical protein
VLGAFVLGLPLALGHDEGFLGAALLAVAAPSVAVIYLLVRGTQIGFSADEDGIVVQNFWRTTRWAWSDVAELVTGPAATAWQTGSGHLALVAVAKSGRRVIATGTTTSQTRSELLALELAPVFALADHHGVRWEWRDLTPEQLAEIKRKVDAVRRITTVVRHFK